MSPLAPGMPISLEHLPADVFGLGSLERAALAADPAPRGLEGPLVPRRLDGIEPPAILADEEERADRVVRWEQGLSKLEPPVAALDNLRVLADPAASIVLTESMPTLFGGTLEGLLGALHAIRLARDLAARWGRPVVPVLWSCADDLLTGDERATFLNENLDLRAVALSRAEASCPRPARRPLEGARDGLGALHALVRSLVWEGEHTEEMLALFLPREGETLAQTHARAVNGLLGHLGLVVLDPDWLRGELSRTLARLVTRCLAAGLRDDAARLGEHAYEVAHDPDGCPLVHRLGLADPTALRLGGDGFRYGGEAGSRTPAELAAEIVQAPAEWIAGAVLRPRLQTALLPLAARVGGWQELTSLAQTTTLRRTGGLPSVPFVPRLSATLVEPECARSLERLELDVRSVLEGRLGEPVPGEAAVAAAERLREIAGRAAGELLAARTDLDGVDRGLSVRAKRTAGQIRELVEGIAKRAERVVRNREGSGRRHVRRVRNHLLPHGLPQERVLSGLAFVARHGRDWLEELVAELEPLAAEHLVVRLDPS